MEQSGEGTRRLATVMFLDMVGYSARMSRDEGRAMESVRDLEAMLRDQVPAHGGRLVKFMGDGSMAVFQTAGEAVACALKIQETIASRNKLSVDAQRYQVRVGLHLGEILEVAGDIFGESVNIAARIQPLADPGGIALSQSVHAQVRNQMSLRGTNLRNLKLKNISERIVVFFVPPFGVPFAVWYVKRHRRAFAIAGFVFAVASVLMVYAMRLQQSRDVIIDDYEVSHAIAAYAGGGATVLVDSAAGPVGRAISIAYSGGVSGYWGVVQPVHFVHHGDLRRFSGIKFLMKSEQGRPIVVALVERGARNPNETGEAWVYTLQPPTAWESVTIPFVAFSRRVDFQPADADNNGRLDLDRILNIQLLHSKSEMRDTLMIESLVLARQRGVVSTPMQLTGPAEGLGGVRYEYRTISSADSGSRDAKYVFDWGDGTVTETPFMPTGTTVAAAHVWRMPGRYSIRAMATGAGGEKSEWSVPLGVAVSDYVLADFESNAEFWNYASVGGTVLMESAPGCEGQGLKVTYRNPANGTCGVVLPGGPVNDGNWGMFRGVKFLIKGDQAHSVGVSITERGKTDPSHDGEVWVQSISLEPNCVLVDLPFSSFKRNPYFQHPDADGNGRFNLEAIRSIQVTITGKKSGVLFLDEVRLAGDGAGAPAGEPLVPTPDGREAPEAPMVLLEDFSDIRDVFVTSGGGFKVATRLEKGPANECFCVSVGGRPTPDAHWNLEKQGRALSGGDWTEFSGVRFLLKSGDGRNIEISIWESKGGKLGEAWVYAFSPAAGWNEYIIPMGEFYRRDDYQPPTANPNDRLDLKSVHRLAFIQSDLEPRSFCIDELALTKGPVRNAMRSWPGAVRR